MSTAVRVSEKLVRAARLVSAVDNRSITGQIEHWARIGKCAEENPDLPYQLIKEILMGVEELDQGEYSEYEFGWSAVQILQSGLFRKKVRKFGEQEKRILDSQIRKILNDPSIGQKKRGDLKDVLVHKFKVHATQFLLSYRVVGDHLELITIGPHENYYRDLSNYLKTR
jgi:mRNA interferase RelE/StbE